MAKPRKKKSRPRSQSDPNGRLGVWVAVLVAIVTFAVFLPALRNEFVNWDDDDLLVKNTHYQGLGWEQLRWMFTTFHLGHYQPLSWVTFGFDYLLWGTNPSGYHLTNIILHAANAVLFYFLSRRLMAIAMSGASDKKSWQLNLSAGFAALLFAIHPLRVESVAWATERRDVLSGLFFFATIYCYLRAVMSPQQPSFYRRWLGAAIVVYALSLLSKATAMTLPVVLVLLDVFPLRRLQGGLLNWFKPQLRSVLWEKLPFFVLALIFAATALLAQHTTGALKPLQQYDVASRMGQAFYGLIFYLWKTFLPMGLSPLYELPPESGPWFWIIAMSAGGIVVALSAALFFLRRRCPAAGACWLYYVLMIAPVLGIAQSGPQLVADRYSYLACLGWALLAGAASAPLWNLRSQGALSPVTLNLVRAGAAASLFTLGILTWQQTQVWHDSERLWRHALNIDPNSSYAYTNLAAAMKNQGKVDEAIRYYGSAVRLRPDLALAHENLGDLFLDRGDLDKAARSYRRILEINPTSAKGYQRLAAVMAKQARFEEAVALYSKALQVDPNDASVHNDLGNTWVSLGRLEKAMEHYRKAAQLGSSRSEPYFNLGNLMVRQGNLQQAIVYYQQALRIDPDNAQAHHNLGRLLAAGGRLDEAVDHFRQAVRVQPNFMAARESLVLALEEQGKKEEASREYAEAMQMLKGRDHGSNR